MKKRFEVLDIFRGLSATMIVFFHMSVFSDTPVINNSFVINSDHFVDFFFVLSGFVISHSYRYISSTDKLQQFLKKRLFRMYPLHVVMLLAFGLITIATQLYEGSIPIQSLFNPDNNLLSFITSLLLLKAIKFPGVTGESWNISSWTISAGMICYFFFGGLMLLLYEIKKSHYKKYFSAIIVAVSVAVLTFVNGNGILNNSYDFGYLRGLAGFFTGVLCHITYKSLQIRLNAMSSRFFTIAEATLLLSIAFFIYSGNIFKQFGVVYQVLFFLSILIFSFEKGSISGLLRQSGLLQRMGKYAYSIYMTHMLLLSLFNFAFIDLLRLSPSSYTWLFPLNFLFIYEVSKWTYIHIEMRFAYKEKEIKPVQSPPKKIIYAKGILNKYNASTDTTS